MRRLRFWCIAAMVGFVAACGPPGREIRGVVLISFDTTRADHLSCYGFPQATTPHVDLLAERGTRFERVVSPVPITLPAHASMLTGLEPPQHGVHDNMNYRLADHVTTLAERLREAGFATGGFVSAFVLDRRFGLAQGFDSYDDRFEGTGRRTDFGVERPGAETARRAVAWLEAHAGERFFLFVHLYEPHEPYEPPEPFASRFPDDPYAGEISAADAAAGKVLAALDRLGLTDQTLVMVVGDHGEMLGEHGERTHTYFLYRGAVEVPWVVAGPGVERGRAIGHRVGLVDLVPTVCGLLGLEPPAGVAGRDLSPWLVGRPPQRDLSRSYLIESVTPTRYGANPLVGVVTGRWKYIRTTRSELYDLEADPGETHNLFDPQRDEVRHLQRELNAHLESARESGRAESDREAVAKLRSLGYLSGGVRDDLRVEAGRPDPKDLIGLHVKHQRAIRLISAGELDEAERLCREILAAHPRFWEAATNLARVALARKDWAEAVRRYRRTLELKPDQYHALFDLGVALTHLGRHNEAVEAFRQAVPLDPEPPKARFNLGVALLQAGRPGEAVAELERALRLAPNDPRVVHRLAQALTAAGKLDQAEARLTAAVQRLPEEARLLFDLAQVRLRLGDEAGAVKALRRMVAAAPRDPRMRRRVERLLAAQGRGDLLGRVLDDVGGGGSVEHAVVLAQQGRLDEAESELRRVLQDNPEHAGAWLNLGMIAVQRSGVPDGVREALPSFQRAAQLDPELAEARFNLGLAYATLGRLAEARRELEAAKKLAHAQGKPGLESRIENALAGLGS